MSDGRLIGILVVIAVLYFVPTIVAFYLKHRNVAAICVLNTLLGWSLLGWVVALVWAFMEGSTEISRAQASALEANSPNPPSPPNPPIPLVPTAFPQSRSKWIIFSICLAGFVGACGYATRNYLHSVLKPPVVRSVADHSEPTRLKPKCVELIQTPEESRPPIQPVTVEQLVDMDGISGLYERIEFSEDAGEWFGFRIFVVDSDDDYYVVVQDVVESPQPPQLVKAIVRKSKIEFSFLRNGEQATFCGMFAKKMLRGHFLDRKDELRLSRKYSH